MPLTRTHPAAYQNKQPTVFYSCHQSLGPKGCITVLPCMGFIECNAVFYAVHNYQYCSYSPVYTVVGQIKADVRKLMLYRQNQHQHHRVPSVIQIAIALRMDRNHSHEAKSVLYFPETNGITSNFVLYHSHSRIEGSIIRIQRHFRRSVLLRTLKHKEWIGRVRNLLFLRSKLSIFPNELFQVIITYVMDRDINSEKCFRNSPISCVQIEDLQDIDPPN